jgi:hypothetical protein
LTQALRSKPDAQWLLDERDSFVNSLTSLIFESPEHIGPAIFAYEAIDKGLPMPPFQLVVLTGGAVMSLCRQLASDHSEPADRILHLLESAEKVHEERLEEEEREDTQSLLDHAFDAYALAVAVAREEMFAQVMEAASRLDMQVRMVPSYRINQAALNEAKAPMLGFLTDMKSAVRRAAHVARNPELRGQIGSFVDRIAAAHEAVRTIGGRRW